MVVGSEMSSDSAQNRRGIDPDSIRNRLEIVFDPRPSRTEAAPITDENGDGADPAMGIGAVAVVAERLWSYRFERCLMRAVNSWTWS
jgi:hypothetical protein